MSNRMTVTLEIEDGIVQKVLFNGTPAEKEQQSIEELYKVQTEGGFQHVSTLFFSRVDLPVKTGESPLSLCCHWVWQGGKWVWKCDPC